ncbi:CTLH/CRA C-terminal to lish motif domain-containing protein [Chytridium lagenaria]|nr:CTLH/CRA C-terminal to lish motif domain-containing protein [Chytridium lagenaria]
MNYLVIEGYKDAAERFSEESGLVPGVDLVSIEDRMNIRKAVQIGHIDEAIERVNDLDPEILDTNPKLFFHLQQQKLIEYIRAGRITEALEFAQEELAPRGEENRTMALLAFEELDRSPVADLLDYSQRQKTASELNAAILSSQNQEKDPKTTNTLKNAWMGSGDRLISKIHFPKISNVMTAELEDPSS